MLLYDYYLEEIKPPDNRVYHIKGRRGCWMQDHILEIFQRYARCEIQSVWETEKDVWIELAPGFPVNEIPQMEGTREELNGL